jgi:arginine decarboxylase
MTELLEIRHAVPRRRAALSIRVSGGSGAGRTPLSAFDAALRAAGVENFNLVRLSSVIPPDAVVSHVVGADQLRGQWGDRLYCVYAEQRATLPGEQAWAGIGWVFCHDDEAGGLFVEHEGPSREFVTRSITDSLADLTAGRPQTFGPIQMQLASAVCVDVPVCAMVVASFETDTWRRAARSPARSGG